MTIVAPKPTLVSACLLGKPCRYDGTAATDSAVLASCHQRTFIPICPEVDGGLPIPRTPAEIVGGDGYEVLEGKIRVIDRDGVDRTEQYLAGAQAALEAARQSGAREAWVKSRSPACGCGTIYDGTFSGKIRSGVGVATAMLLKSGIVCREWAGGATPCPTSEKSR